jgi:hypothetical protein
MNAVNTIAAVPALLVSVKEVATTPWEILRAPAHDCICNLIKTHTWVLNLFAFYVHSQNPEPNPRVAFVPPIEIDRH